MTNKKKQIMKTNYNNREKNPIQRGKTSNNGMNIHIGKIEIKIPITINIYNR